ncbi:MAG: acyl-CoA desaturase [Gammaproteobacteria bacterium]|nr:acyl-CoA desaturase [Gammaproteobacteria bacterium]
MNQVHFPAGQRPVYQQLSAQVNQYFQQQGIAKSGDQRLYRKAILILLLFSASYAALLLLPAPWSLAAWFIHGIATALVGFNVMHDGAHESFSRSRRLNRLAALTFNLIGSNRFYWAQKHNRNHHSFTNVDEVDEDIDALGLFRMSPHQRRFWFHRYQHIYVWLLYPLTSLFWFFALDYKAYFRQKIAQRPFSHRLSAADHLEFWASKLLYLLIYIALPLSLADSTTVITGFLLMHAILGFLFAVVFQLAHIVEQAEFPQPTTDGSMEDEWAAHQLRTTVDFATDSRFLTWALGGLNFQVEHHLFPRVSHIHYPALHRLLQESCNRQGHSIRSYPSLGAALKGHYHHLRQLGRSDG